MIPAGELKSKLSVNLVVNDYILSENNFSGFENKKIVLYSFCCGDILSFPNIKYKHPNVDYVMFTDKPNISSNGWLIRSDIPKYEKIWDQNKAVKWNPYNLFDTKYDYAMYVDSKVMFNVNPLKIIEHAGALKHGMATFKHKEYN